MTDLNHATHGFFTTFYPVSAQGKSAWETIAAQTNGTGKVLKEHAPSVIAQLKAAGYTVRKKRDTKPTQTDEQLLAALGL